MSITHIFFDLHVLIDSKRMLQNHRRGVGQIMAQRYGKAPEIWETAHRQIAADWDSYFADLNLSGDDMLRDLKEGWLRVTRALFRLAQVTEPAKGEIVTLSMELPANAPAYGDALYEDARFAVNQLHEKGFRLGVVTHALVGQVQAALRGANMLDCFTAPIVGADTVGQFDKDKIFFIKVGSLAQVAAAQCLIVDNSEQALIGAKAAGMVTVRVNRQRETTADSINDLRQLLLMDWAS
jgi:FMN phosphatase YigB (HAD superfamily)